MVKSISSSVVNLPKLKRIEHKASSSDNPKAFKTCDGFDVTAEQAEPLETEILPKDKISCSDQTPGKHMLEVL